MLTKFGLLIDFDVTNTVASTSGKAEVVLSRCSRHLEKSIWRHIIYFGIVWSDVDEVWQHYAEYHADYGDVVKVKTRRRILTWQTFVFPKRK